MFSVIIAWVVFVFVSFCIPFWIYERMTLPETECWIRNYSVSSDYPEHLKGKRVEIVLRDGTRNEDYANADWMDWSIEDVPGDIVKYRVID